MWSIQVIQGKYVKIRTNEAKTGYMEVKIKNRRCTSTSCGYYNTFRLNETG